MSMYNVIWFDDECNMLPLIKENASLNNIILKGFENAEDGIKELENNILQYDAAVVDGIFFRKRGQTGDAKNQSALSDVAMALERLVNKKKLPWFILSGQASFTKEKNPFANAFKDNKVYDKLNDQDLNDLWNNIKEEANQQQETQIRHKYQRVFDMCNDKYLGENVNPYLLQAIKLEQSDEIKDIVKSFNGLRDIVEILFKKLNELQIIPDEVFKNQGWINKSSLFLSGKHESFKWLENPIHPLIVFQLHNVLQLVQDASHEIPEKLTLKVKQHIEMNNTTYLYKSSLFQLLDVLVWFKDYIDKNPDAAENNKLWTSPPSVEEGDWIEGKVIRIADNGFGTFQPANGGSTLSIVPYKVKEFSLTVNQSLEVTVKIDNNKTLIQNLRKL